jgi:hypothetical protein
VCPASVTAKYSDFTYLKDALDLTDGNLTRVRFTWRGCRGHDHLKAMQDLINRVNKEKR